MNLEWNVYRWDINARKLVVYNIMRHRGFIEWLGKRLVGCKDKDASGEVIRRELQYYFWSKCEHELLIGALFEGDTNKFEKIDVYDQVMLNFNNFTNYVWDNRFEIIKASKECK